MCNWGAAVNKHPINIDDRTYALLMKKKAEIIEKENVTITFSEIIERLLN